MAPIIQGFAQIKLLFLWRFRSSLQGECCQLSDRRPAVHLPYTCRTLAVHLPSLISGYCPTFLFSLFSLIKIRLINHN